MDFSSILEKMENSKNIKTRRKSWPDGVYIKMIDNIPKMYHKDASFFSYDLSIINSHDWIVVGDEEKKTFRFTEAIKELKNGKSVRLSSWDNTTYIMSDQQNLMQFKEVEYNFVPTYICFISDDWEIIA